ncbi:hypothetical protein ACPYO6_02325 [Georgenia sp. Z1344]|uniref:hypothetical protein n=1 Tax=Georgenia sp. Z1344 TaxID=3416706 RepID=UPI003CF37F47
MIVEGERVVLAAAWVCLMLVYLLGDVLRIFAGDAEPGQMGGQTVSGGAWVGAALIMLVPIVMVMVSLLVPAGPLRWVTVVVAVGLALFNVLGLPYPGAYDNLLIVVGIAWVLVIGWLAWRWLPVATTTPVGAAV